MYIEYSPSFKKRYKKLQSDIRMQVKLKGEIFKEDPFHHTLKTHKLHGKMKNFWAFSVNYDYRIVFRFVYQGNIRFEDVGKHNIYE